MTSCEGGIANQPPLSLDDTEFGQTFQNEVSAESDSGDRGCRNPSGDSFSLVWMLFYGQLQFFRN